MIEDSAINSLKTREQRFRAKKWNDMYISRTVIKSKAFLSLKTAAACKVFLIFLNKKVMKPVQGKKGKRKNQYVCVNNGEIEFSYTEAESYGITEGQFKRAISELVEKGLIDITKSGYGLYKDTTKYAISDRWEKYGTSEFIFKQRPKRHDKLGFKKGNKFGRNCGKKENSTVIDNGSTTVMNNGCKMSECDF